MTASEAGEKSPTLPRVNSFFPLLSETETEEVRSVGLAVFLGPSGVVGDEAVTAAVIFRKMKDLCWLRSVVVVAEAPGCRFKGILLRCLVDTLEGEPASLVDASGGETAGLVNAFGDDSTTSDDAFGGETTVEV